MSDTQFISTASALEDLCASLDTAQLVAIDTEFVRESTYFAELCLIQIATDKHVACIDCCADLSLEPLFALLFRPQVRLLAHSGRQDLELLQQSAGELPARLLDTQIAAGLLGHSAQIGLRELLADRLDVEIEKGLARTDWRKRPLSDKAIEYAANDVIHLAALWRMLAEALHEKDRMDWFDEDCARALSVELEPGLVTLYQRTRGTGRLRGEQMNAALALLQWREAVARNANRPRRWILADDVLVELARRMPNDAATLGRISALSGKTRSRHGDALLGAIAESEARKYSDLAAQCVPPPRPDPHALREQQQVVQRSAAQLGIEPEIIATKKDIAAAIRGEAPEHLRAGWRARVLEAVA